MANRQTPSTTKVGVFVAIGVLLIMVSIALLGGPTSFLTKNYVYSIKFNSAEGVIPGAKVVLAGIQVGVVSKVEYSPTDRVVTVEISVPKDYTGWIKSDSYAELTTQGVLGDKLVSLSTGSLEAPVIAIGGVIPSKDAQSFTAMLTKSDQLLASLTNASQSLERVLKSFEKNHRNEQFFENMASTSKNMASATAKLDQKLSEMDLKKATNNLASILEKVNNGTGTLGALVNDPGLYDDVKALFGGANRNRIVRNLVRQTVKDGEKEEANEVKQEQKKK